MRTKEGQEKHDKFVGTAALFLKQKGFNKMYVDLPNFAKPPKVNGYIPDIYAVKTKLLISGLTLPVETLLVEVETEDTQNTMSAMLQHFAFQKWASENRQTFFEVIIAK